MVPICHQVLYLLTFLSCLTFLQLLHLLEVLYLQLHLSFLYLHKVPLVQVLQVLLYHLLGLQDHHGQLVPSLQEHQQLPYLLQVLKYLMVLEVLYLQVLLVVLIHLLDLLVLFFLLVLFYL